MSVSENIRTVRQRSLLNQESFAEALNVSLITVHRWESGKSLPNLTAMRSLKEFCARRDYPYSLLESDWLAERMAERRRKIEKKAAELAEAREKLTETVSEVKDILVSAGGSVAGKCEMK